MEVHVKAVAVRASATKVNWNAIKSQVWTGFAVKQETGENN